LILLGVHCFILRAWVRGRESGSGGCIQSPLRVRGSANSHRRPQAKNSAAQ
jgi:hypothetical protein